MTLGTSQVAPGDRLRVIVSGVAGHDEVEIGIASTYTALATAAVAGGSVDVTVRVPTAIAPGTHEIQVRADGEILARAEAVLVTASGGLAETGRASLPAVAAALALLTVGTAVLVARRRVALGTPAA